MLTKGKIVPNLPSELFEIGHVRQFHVGRLQNGLFEPIQRLCQ